ncbi:MAG: heavy metal sensor histidine kinase [Verrucomicrobiota bacterium]|nr:heavy metal sensor histidine kinase [Verrucomicrobiota bacterium]
MPSRRPRSIRWQLIVYFTAASTLLLLIGLAIFYSFVVTHGYEEDNRYFADKVSVLRDRLRNPDAMEWTEPQGGDTYWLRLLRADGSIVVESPAMNALLPSSLFPPPATGDAIAKARMRRVGDREFSLLSNNIRSSADTYILQIAQDRSEDENFAIEFGVVFAAVAAAGFLLCAGTAVIVTRKALRPLEEMTASLQRVDQRRLNEQVPYTHWPRELQPLALAFEQMLRRLSDSFARLSQFSADLAHELRTPVANLLGEAQVALTRGRTADEYREVLESSATECERLARIIDHLLFLARAEAAERKVEPVRFDGRATLARLVSFYGTLADEKNIALHCEGDGEIIADPILFDRAIGNLLENALRHTPEHGAITLRLTQQRDQTLVEVTDTGSGIAAADLPRVFDRFYRADSSRSSEGMGLGLSLVKSIAQLHGGSVELQSEVGRGTTVTFSFPFDAKAAV